MIHAYMDLWPDNPFLFRIPYQKHPYNLRKKYSKEKVEFIKTEQNIKDTMFGLLEDLDDDDWIYWCMDDYYPVKLWVNEISAIYNWIKTITDNNIANILFTHERSDLQYYANNIMSRKHSIKDRDKIVYYRIRNYRIIWFHQFMRVKILRFFFDNLPDDISTAKNMDYYKDRFDLPKHFERYVCSKRFLVIGESTNRGKLTLNCAKSMKKYKLTLPQDFEVINKEIFRGSKEYERSFMYYLSRNIYHRLKNKYKNQIGLLCKR